MKVIADIAKMQEFGRQVRTGGLRLGLVPTMGYLHEGHLELLRRARAECDVVVASIFVNPTQFNNPDDFAHYPRDPDADAALLAEERVDVLFVPEASVVYAADASTRVSVEGLGSSLCGPGRPGHFDGVATVVAALFNMVGPDLAFFGEKDYQQLQIIRRMVRDLHFPLRVVGVANVRERDGLALSSRNARLSDEQRRVAPAIYEALHAAADSYLDGETNAASLQVAARARLAAHPSIAVEYLEIVDGDSLQSVETADDSSVIAVAAELGAVRLIDNIIFARARREREAAARLGAEASPMGVGTDA